jgi:SAM-dependent methyltransferase
MKRAIHTLLTLLTLGLSLLTGQTCCRAAAPATNAAPLRNTIPYVPTRHDAVRDLLWLAEAGTNDVVYDLGSGDGRVVIAAVRDFGVRKAVGIEVNPQLVRESRENAAQAGLAERVQFLQGDLFTNDFSEASVVVIYLGHGANLDLRAQLVRSLKPGARVVSHQFGMGEWPADKLLDVRTVFLGMYGERYNEFKTNPEVPDYDSTGSQASHDVLSEWIVPAPVAGVWRGKVHTGSGERELALTLHQRLSRVTGSFELQGPTNFSGHVQADLWGDHMRCLCIATNQGSYWHQMWFDGHTANDTIDGNLWMPQGNETRKVHWAGWRNKTDFTGTWEWTGPMDSPVQLKVERREGRLAATYADGKQTLPVRDLYDFGGGFYFTLLLGLQGDSYTSSGRRIGPEDGWLIGEAIAHDHGLAGAIAFYPYHTRNALGFPVGVEPLKPEGKRGPQEGPRDWRPTRVAP